MTQAGVVKFNFMTSHLAEKAARAPRNRTLVVEPSEVPLLQQKIVRSSHGDASVIPPNTIICGDAFEVLPQMPTGCYDLLFADPPYNLTKVFGSERFARSSAEKYAEWLDSWLRLCRPLLKDSASVYICGDWSSSSAIQVAGSKYFTLRNRITWEREKGRGAKANWKNAAEDIWFFTVSDKYTFNLEAVKQRRRVIAPYREDGRPKDWIDTGEGKYRDTHPSNIWTDISVPFWSMPENTDHPTQKPEKLLAKIILASTSPGDLILDPFAGSGTTAVAAKKLGRNFSLIESDNSFCLVAQKRIDAAEDTGRIQGYSDGIFWERNSAGRPE